MCLNKKSDAGYAHSRKGITVIPITLEEHKILPGQCTLNNGQESIGAITVVFPKRSNSRSAKIVKAVSTISGVDITICVVLVSGVLVKFTGPDYHLNECRFAHGAKGDLNQKIDTSGRDELGTLSPGAFATCAMKFNRKIEELQHLNAELDQRVEERTAEWCVRSIF